MTRTRLGLALSDPLRWGPVRVYAWGMASTLPFLLAAVTAALVVFVAGPDPVPSPIDLDVFGVSGRDASDFQRAVAGKLREDLADWERTLLYGAEPRPKTFLGARIVEDPLLPPGRVYMVTESVFRDDLPWDFFHEPALGQQILEVDDGVA